MNPFKRKRNSALIDNEPVAKKKALIPNEIWIAMGILLVGLFCVYLLFQNAPTAAPVLEKKEHITNVSIQRVQPTSTSIPINISGVVEVTDIKPISANISGNIIAISPNFRDNQYINKGEWLFKVDNSQFSAEIDQLRAQLSSAKIAYQTAKLTNDTNAAALRDFGINAKRSSPQMLEANTRINAIQSQINAIQQKLSKNTMYAPFSAKIIKTSLNVGDLIGNGIPIAQSILNDKVTAKLSINESDLAILEAPRFNQQNNVPVTIMKLGTDKSWFGIAKGIEKGTLLESQFNFLKVEISNAGSSNDGENSLSPGESVNTTIESPVFENLFILSPELIRNGNQVWLLENNQLLIRDIEIIYRNKDRVYVSAGLKANDSVISSNIHLPVSGMKLRAVKN